MAFQRIPPPPGQGDVDEALADHWVACPFWDCSERFDPFEIVKHGGIPAHECGDLFGDGAH